jgi:hypothetical protein
MGEDKLNGLWSHTTHVTVRSDSSHATFSPRQKAHRHQDAHGAATGRFRARVKQGLPATRRLLALVVLLYLGENIARSTISIIELS